MSNDCEELVWDDTPIKKKSKKPDDFLSIIVDKVYNFDWLLLLAVAICYLFIVSDIYQERIVQNIQGAIDNSGDLTTFGYMFQLISLLVGSIILRVLFGFSKN